MNMSSISSVHIPFNIHVYKHRLNVDKQSAKSISSLGSEGRSPNPALQIAVLCIALYCSICDALSLQCTVVHLYCTELVTGEHSATFQHLKDTSAEARPGQWDSIRVILREQIRRSSKLLNCANSNQMDCHCAPWSLNHNFTTTRLYFYTRRSFPEILGQNIVGFKSVQ